MADLQALSRDAVAASGRLGSSRRRQSRLRGVLRGRVFLQMAGVTGALAAWQLYAVVSANRMMPRLGAICSALLDLATSGQLWDQGSSTLRLAFTGLAIALVAGTVLGILAGRSQVLGALLEPLVDLGYPVPKLALYPILIIVLGLGAPSKIAQVSMECFFPLFVHACAGARAVDRNMVWLGRNSGAGRLRMLLDVILPSTLPTILTGLRVAAPIMLIVITVTELIGESTGLGFLIRNSASQFQPATTWAVIAVLGIVGYVMDRLIVLLRTKVVFWEQASRLAS